MKKIRYIPYGYTMCEGQTEIACDEADVVRYIFDAYIKGASLKEIADDLTRRQISYTEKTCVWDKARIARIIDNDRYIGYNDYEPIVDKSTYEEAAAVKNAKQRNQIEKECEGIAIIRNKVKCGQCEYPMVRRVTSKRTIKESWICTNPECGTRFRISDSNLLLKINLLINRIIENTELMIPKPKQQHSDSLLVQELQNEIDAEVMREHPSEMFVVEKIRDIASQLYRETNAKEMIVAQIARKRALLMMPQEAFNGEYFTALIEAVILGKDGNVTLITKTETVVSEIGVVCDGGSKIPKKTVTLIEPKRSILVDKEKYDQKRVAAYCRVSTDSEEQLTSYKNQMKVYTEMIAANTEWKFAGLYADEGISGTRADKRPRFKQMINDCLAGKIDYIITKSVSRFARNTVDCLDTVRMLKARGIGIYFEEQHIDTLKSDSELYLVIYAGFAQSESESISKNVMWTYRKKFEEGKAVFIYSKMLGYRKGADGNPEIVPQEAEIVERIFRMYLSGMTTKSISTTLKAENIVIPNKQFSFSKTMIQSMLRNERYCGDCILQKTVTVDCISKTRKVNQGEAPMYIVENNHPAIIPRVIFNKTQEEIYRRQTLKPKSSKRTITASGKYSKYALTQVLKCGECGTAYRRVTWTSGGHRRIVWRCINRLDNGKRFCKESPTIPEAALHEAIVRAINRFSQENEATYMALMKATIGEALGWGRDSDEVDLLLRRIDALNDRMLTLVNETVQNGGDMEDCEDEFKAISEQIEQLKQHVETIRRSQSQGAAYEKRLATIQKTIDQRQANRSTYDDTIVRQMVECIKVHNGGRLEVIFGGGYAVEEYIE